MKQYKQPTTEVLFISLEDMIASSTIEFNNDPFNGTFDSKGKDEWATSEGEEW